MPRYFIEVAYCGTNYAGFQKQDNANTVQAEVEKALEIFYRQRFELTGSSRTDAGVHAHQNYFHFDTELDLKTDTYNINAILPEDIVVKSIVHVDQNRHSRFNAQSREYHYYIYQQKNPFLQHNAFFVPYPIEFDLLQQAAAEILNQRDFTSFAKRNTQVGSFQCTVFTSEWIKQEDCFVYRVKANRFLRGMVKGLVGTMLLVAKKKISVEEFRLVFQAKDCTKADFSVPSHGLFLHKVAF